MGKEQFFNLQVTVNKQRYVTDSIPPSPSLCIWLKINPAKIHDPIARVLVALLYQGHYATRILIWITH